MTSNVNISWEQTAGLPFCKVEADNDVIGHLEATMLIDAYGDVRIDAVSYIQQSLSLARVTAVARVNRVMVAHVNAAPYYSVKQGRDKKKLDFRSSTPFLLLQEVLEGFKSTKAECEAAEALRVMRDAVKSSEEALDKKFWVSDKFLSPYKGLGALRTKGGEDILTNDAKEELKPEEEVVEHPQPEIVLPDDLFLAEERDEKTTATISKLEKIERIIHELKGLAKEVNVEINISIRG